MRTALFLGILSATRWNPVIRLFYERLRSQGKPGRVAQTACMRKLLVILNAKVRDGQSWDPSIPLYIRINVRPSPRTPITAPLIRQSVSSRIDPDGCYSFASAPSPTQLGRARKPSLPHAGILRGVQRRSLILRTPVERHRVPKPLWNALFESSALR